MGEINQSSKQIMDYQMDKPIVLLRKFRGLSKENQKDWVKVIESAKNSNKEKAIASYLQLILEKRGALTDLPCYSSPVPQDKFKKKILEYCKCIGDNNLFSMYCSKEPKSIEIVKILAPLTDNPNGPGYAGRTPIWWAAFNGNTELVKILAPFTDNPNAPNNDGNSPIHLAARLGLTEIVKILAPLTDNPNAPNNVGSTPINKAAYWGHTEIVKILSPLTDNPNAPDNDRNTPIYGAALKGHTEIIKILAPLTDNPNAPNNYGETPSKATKNAEICRFLESFNTFRKRKAGPPNKPRKSKSIILY